MRSVFVPAVTGMLVRAADRPGLGVPAVRLRPLAPGETGAVERVFAGMSAESRLMRFLAPVPRLGERALRRLADVDHDRHGCWVAVVGGVPVALGRYVRLPAEPGVAEVALDVVDDMQGRGLGKLLLATVAVAAADAGVRSLLWVMDPANERARRLLKPLDAPFSIADRVLEARSGLPDIGVLDVEEVLRLARAARQSADWASDDVSGVA